jgi:hypothetical protein
MPYLEELLDTLRFNRLVGQKPFGHWDHDAKCVIGPPVSPESLAVSVTAVPASVGQCDASEVVVYEQYVEPRTGELLLIVQKSGTGECLS